MGKIKIILYNVKVDKNPVSIMLLSLCVSLCDQCKGLTRKDSHDKPHGGGGTKVRHMAIIGVGFKVIERLKFVKVV
jgi:hypothetical protein